MPSASVPPMSLPEIDRFKLWLERTDLKENFRQRVNELLNQEHAARVQIDQADAKSAELRKREDAVQAHEADLSIRERAVEATKVQIANEKLQVAEIKADVDRKTAALERIRHELDHQVMP